jgi:hypothetical protein
VCECECVYVCVCKAEYLNSQVEFPHLSALCSKANVFSKPQCPHL